MKKQVEVKNAVVQSARLAFEGTLAEKMPPINCVVTVSTQEFEQQIEFCVANSDPSEVQEATYQLLDLSDLLGTAELDGFAGKELQVMVCYESVFGPEYIYALGVAGKYIIPRVNVTDPEMEQQYYTESEVRAVIDKEEYC